MALFVSAGFFIVQSAQALEQEHGQHLIKHVADPGDGRGKPPCAKHLDRAGHLPFEALREALDHTGKAKNNAVLDAGGGIAARCWLVGAHVKVNYWQLGGLARKRGQGRARTGKIRPPM